MDVCIKELPERNVAYLKCKGSWKQIPIIVASLTDILVSKFIPTEGPPFGIYYNTQSEVAVDDLDWEIAYPISALYGLLPEDSSGFGIRLLPSVQVAATVFKGLYRKTGGIYAALNEWVLENGFKVCGPSQEEYPYGLVDTQADQVIEICLPVCSKD